MATVRLSLYFRHVRPRGSTTNPPNRFESLRYEPTAPEAYALASGNPETRLLADPSRTIVATNNSPDIGFDASVNPYGGCEHACSYCLAPETPILHADLTWRPLGEVRTGDTLVGFDEYPQRGRGRGLRRAQPRDAPAGGPFAHDRRHQQQSRHRLRREREPLPGL